jgi:hypothetical protein
MHSIWRHSSCSLTIRAADGVRPVIVVGDRPLRVWAERLLLQNLTFRQEHAESPSAGSEPGALAALLAVESQQLLVDGCQFETSTSGPATTAIAWRSMDEVSPVKERIAVQNSVCLGPCCLLSLSAVPAHVLAQKVLKVNGGP